MFVARKRTEAAFTSAEWMACVAFSFLLLVMMVNFIAIQYGRGVLRAAADEGARTGARVATDPQVPLAACRARAQNVLDGLGAMATDVQSTCVVQGNNVRSETTATFDGWLPIVPPLTFHATATSASEQKLNPQLAVQP